MELILGHPLDDFQKRCLAVIGAVIGMAPTGSGKTVIALMAACVPEAVGCVSVQVSKHTVCFTPAASSAKIRTPAV